MGSEKNNIVNFDEQLLSCIREFKNDRVKELVQASQLYCSIDATGNTLLHYSVRYDNADIALFLLDNGCSVNSQDSMGNTPLMLAAKQDKQTSMTVLLAHNADVFLTNNEKKNVLHMLSGCSSLKQTLSVCSLFYIEFQKTSDTNKILVDKLIEVGFDIYLASYLANYEIIKSMVKRGYPINAHSLYKYTPLHVAVCLGNLYSVKILLRYGANAKALDYKNASALYYLYKYFDEPRIQKVEILKILLHLEVSPMDCNLDGYFDIVYTLYKGNRNAIRVLLQSNKLDFAARDKNYGKTALHYLAKNTNQGISEELQLHTSLSYDINAVDFRGTSVLCAAIKEGNPYMVEFLLKRGVEPMRDENLLLYYACIKSKPEHQDEYNKCVELLLEYNEDPQYIVTEANDKEITAFDTVLKTNNLNGIQPVIAEISIQEKLGIEIFEITRRKMNSHRAFSEYHNKCRQLIEENIFGSVTLFRLLTCGFNTLERYLNNKELQREIELFNKQHEMKSSHSYLYRKWLKRQREVEEYVKLKQKIVEAISKISEKRFIRDHVVSDNIINHLNIQSLRQLSRV